MKMPALLLTLALAPAAQALEPAAPLPSLTCDGVAYLAADAGNVTLRATPGRRAQAVVRLLDARQPLCMSHRPEGGRDWVYVVAMPADASGWCMRNGMYGKEDDPLCRTPLLPLQWIQAPPAGEGCQMRPRPDVRATDPVMHLEGACAQGWLPRKHIDILAG